MSHEIGTATDYADLLLKLNAFITTNGSAFGICFTGAGNGNITGHRGTPSSVAETFTLTATSSSSFTVVGSTSGAMGTATVGSAFSCSKIMFTLNAGATPFSAGDAFKINTAPPWSNVRNGPGYLGAGYEMIWRAPGNDGLRQIFTGVQCRHSTVVDSHYWQIRGFNGFDAGMDFEHQPGGLDTMPHVALWGSTIPYWFVCNGQRVIMVAKVSGCYEHMYLGLYNSYLDPGYHPNPLFIGGSFSYAGELGVDHIYYRYSNNQPYTHAYWLGFADSNAGATNCSGRFRKPTGEYGGVQGYAYWTTANATASWWPLGLYVWSEMMHIRENLDGTYPLLPCIFSSDDGAINYTTQNVWGELDGVFATTGYNNASENTFTDQLYTYLIAQNVFRTTRADFCAIQLD